MTGTLPELQQPPPSPPGQPVTIHPLESSGRASRCLNLTLPTNLLWGSKITGAKITPMSESVSS
eukprot:2081622-Prymnesium_polylepis.1